MNNELNKAPRPAPVEVGDGVTKSAKVRRAIEILRGMEPWDGETYNEELSSLMRDIADTRPAVATPAEVTDALADALAKLVCEPGKPEYRDQARAALAARMQAAQCQVRKDTQGLDDSGRLTPLAPISDAVIAAADIYERERNSGATHDQALGVALSGIASPSAGAVVPEGWRLMPMKLDKSMRKAFELAKQWTTSASAIFTDEDVDHIYSGLLAAAPEVPHG